VTRLAFSPDSRTLVSASADGTVRVWDVETGKVAHALLGHQGHVRSAVFSPTADLIASGDEHGKVRVWDVVSGRLLRIVDGHAGAVLCLAVLPKDKILATGGDDRTVRLWDLGSGRELHSVREHAQPVLAVAFAPGGWSLVWGSEDGTLVWYDLVTGMSRMVPHIQGQPVEQLAFTPNGQRLRILKRAAPASRREDRVEFFFSAVNVATLEAAVSPRPREDILEYASSAALSPDGRLVLYGGLPIDGQMPMTLWNADLRRELGRFRVRHNGGTTPQPVCAISPDGRRAAYTDPTAGHARILNVSLLTPRDLKR
jgi:WD40 repeat protein